MTKSSRIKYPWQLSVESKPTPVPDPPRPKLAVAPVERTALSLHEAAASIGVSASTLAGLGPDGPPSFRLHRRKRRLYPVDSLRAWLARCAAEAEGGEE
jgi:hypothetical protein